MSAIGPVLHDRDAGWMRDAACVPLAWLPWTDPRPDPRDVLAMHEVCAACPVRAACEDYAIATDVTAGWWAGRSFNKYDLHHPPRRDLVAQRGDAA